MKTKEEILAHGLQEYIKLRKSQDECSGFIDGFNFGYNIPDQQTKELRAEIERLKGDKFLVDKKDIQDLKVYFMLVDRGDTDFKALRKRFNQMLLSNENTTYLPTNNI